MVAIPTSIYNREGYCVIDEAHTSFQKVMLNGVDSLSYRGRVEQPFLFPFKTIYFINGTSMDVIDDNFMSC